MSKQELEIKLKQILMELEYLQEQQEKNGQEQKELENFQILKANQGYFLFMVVAITLIALPISISVYYWKNLSHILPFIISLGLLDGLFLLDMKKTNQDRNRYFELNTLTNQELLEKEKEFKENQNRIEKQLETIQSRYEEIKAKQMILTETEMLEKGKTNYANIHFSHDGIESITIEKPKQLQKIR